MTEAKLRSLVNDFTWAVPSAFEIHFELGFATSQGREGWD